ncbi:MAG: Dihydrofolate reductase, partial [uncultured Nocardioides sp.]
AETDLRHEREPGRLHRRARRRPRLGRAERRAVPVVVRPGGGDGPGAVRAQAVGDDELPLADRRSTAWRHSCAGRVRSPLAGHVEGGVLLDDQRGRLERPPGHRRRGHGDHPAQERGRRSSGHRRRHPRRGGHPGRADRRVRDPHPPGPGGRRHAVLHRPGQLGEPEPGGDPDASRRRAPDQVRGQAL